MCYNMYAYISKIKVSLYWTKYKMKYETKCAPRRDHFPLLILASFWIIGFIAWESCPLLILSTQPIDPQCRRPQQHWNRNWHSRNQTFSFQACLLVEPGRASSSSAWRRPSSASCPTAASAWRPVRLRSWTRRLTGCSPHLRRQKLTCPLMTMEQRLQQVLSTISPSWTVSNPSQTLEEKELFQSVIVLST